MSLKDYLGPVETVSPRTPIIEAARKMKGMNVGALVVASDDGKPIGLLTDRDVLLRVVAEGRDLGRTTVEQAMTPTAVYLREDASLGAATEMMASGGIRRVPIVDAQNQLCGMLSLDDLIVLLATELDNLKRAIQEGVRIEQETETAAAASEPAPQQP